MTATRGRRRTVALALAVLTLGVIVTSLVAASFDRRSDTQTETILAARAREAVEVVQGRISRAFDAGVAVRSLVRLHPDLDAGTFRTFAVDGGLVRAHPRLAAVSFARFARANEVADLAAHFAESGVSLTPEPTPGADVVAVEFIAPLEGNETALGLDLLFEERRADAITRARDQGINTITAPITLVQDPPDRPSVLLFVPVYDSDEAPSTGPERRRSFHGVATAVVRTETLLAGIVGPAPIVDLEIDDVGPVGGPEGDPVLAYRFGEPVGEGVSLDTSVGDRRWRLTVGPNAAFPEGGAAGRIARTAGAGLTLALLGLVLTLSLARGRAEAMVQRRTAELRDLNQELVAANLAKSTFLSTVSHELRTPLTAIMGFVTLLRKAEDLTAEAQQDMLRRVDRNAQTLRVLIEELLAYSRLEEDGALDRLDLDLSQVVGQSLRDLVAVMDGVSVQADLRPGVTVHADPHAVDRIVANLVTNAARYGGPGVAVTVTVDQDDEHGVLVVADDGQGIAPEDQDRIFEQFERGRDHTTIPGTGIGLAVVRGLARRHGGDATVASEPGEGASFTVRLAKAPANATAT